MTDIDISILINNVGVQYLNALQDISDQDLHNLLTVNMYGMTLMSKMAVERFKQRYAEKRIRSLICSINSMTSIAPLPYSGTYAAAKNFGNFISEGIYYELHSQGIDSLSCNPGLVATKMIGEKKNADKKSSFRIISPKDCAIATLDKCTSGSTFGAW